MNVELTLTIASIILMGIFLKNLFEVVFRMEYEGTARKRLKSLNYDGFRIGQSEEDGTREFIQKMSDPIIQYVFPYFKFKGNEQINDDLKFVGWGKYVQAEQFRALTFISRVVGVVSLLGLWKLMWPTALLLGGLLLLGPPFFLNMEVEDKRSKMVSELPEIIRLIQGYLAANQTLTESIEHTLPYIAKNWQPVFGDFVKNSRTRNERVALEIMRNEVNIQEVKELLSLIGLSIEQGQNMYEAFDNQHDKVRNMQLAGMMAKIHNRKNMAILVQYPILLMIFVAIGLPTVEMVMSF